MQHSLCAKDASRLSLLLTALLLRVVPPLSVSVLLLRSLVVVVPELVLRLP
ncbi:hypothetical protein ANAPC1_00314 [Anaplasma phagocytophilum]|uniref:Uncharacterized protein n=1 Tax=Anaplasma phagocytophilum TaxID=948 RepID=A0AA45USB5_ANAPH|nr:hypothetical protein ANAPC1_00314 [Anaplasma phagocytophilum]SBO33709.1 hypothetical protein ANAPC2_01433 [Anaplasma phagocytophilum]